LLQRATGPYVSCFAAGRVHTAYMIFRLLRLFMLRYLPRRMFAFLTLIEFALMARKLYKSTTAQKPPAKRKLVLRPVDGNDYDGDIVEDPVVVEGTSRPV
jgi:hypothetical protein